jgi:hypothetical protein
MRAELSQNFLNELAEFPIPFSVLLKVVTCRTAAIDGGGMPNCALQPNPLIHPSWLSGFFSLSPHSASMNFTSPSIIQFAAICRVLAEASAKKQIADARGDSSTFAVQHETIIGCRLKLTFNRFLNSVMSGNLGPDASHTTADRRIWKSHETVFSFRVQLARLQRLSFDFHEKQARKLSHMKNCIVHSTISSSFRGILSSRLPRGR